MNIIDFHVHIDEGENPNANGLPAKMDRHEILKQMNEAGVNTAVMLTMAHSPDMEETISQNNWLSDVCRSDSHFAGFGSVHPDSAEEALFEMERCVLEIGLKGFKLHPNAQNFDCSHPFLINIFKKSAELDVPIIIDTYSPIDDNQPSKLLSIISQCQEAKICLAHVGFARFMDFSIYGLLRNKSVMDCKNVYFDLSASTSFFYKSPFQDQFRWVTEQIGPDNLLFGSDFPLYPIGEALNNVKSFGYPEEWMPKILGGNAARLLKLD